MGKDAKKSKKSKRSKEKKEKRRRRDSSDDSSSDEDARKQNKNEKLIQRIVEHQKKHKKVDSEYTDEANPFGDPNFSKPFVWGKKIEKQIAEGVDVREMSAKAEAKRHQSRLEEAEKVKKRQEQREAEREAMQAELEMIQRERAAAEAVELERKQEDFLLEQSKMRSQARLAEGRPRAVDALAALVYDLPSVDPAELDPGSLLYGPGATLGLLRELRADAAAFQELDRMDAGRAAFWAALETVVGAGLAEAQREEEVDRAKARGEPTPAQYAVREAGWHGSIEADVRAMLAGKTLRELGDLEARIGEQLDSGEAADPEYWQAVLTRLSVERARAFLREFHAEKVRRSTAAMLAEVDVPAAMGWDGAAQEGEEEGAGGEGGERAAVCGRGRSQSPASPGGRAEGGAPGAEPALDPELEVLAAVDGGAAAREAHPGGKPPVAGSTTTPAAPPPRVAPRLAAVQRPSGGEPRPWQDVRAAEELAGTAPPPGPGPYSPRAMDRAALAGREAEVVPEEDDAALLAALRAQVRHREAVRLAAATAAAAVGGDALGSGGDADRLYRQMVADPRAAAGLLGATNPLLRYVADAAPQAGEQAMRSGREPGASGAGDTAEEARLRAAAGAAMGDLGTSGDAPFGGEVALESQAYWWHEKYRPRRPKYFNRVHTGYEWNKYNQTHYDGDNPPPKSVQGYKFNIFYPDLIDKSKSPVYKIEKDPNAVAGETCILRFTAGPPYEDIAFRIVNKDWEYNHKKGFKSVFDRGILHVYFNFRRQRYRR